VRSFAISPAGGPSAIGQETFFFSEPVEPWRNESTRFHLARKANSNWSLWSDAWEWRCEPWNRVPGASRALL